MDPIDATLATLFYKNNRTRDVTAKCLLFMVLAPVHIGCPGLSYAVDNDIGFDVIELLGDRGRIGDVHVRGDRIRKLPLHLHADVAPGTKEENRHDRRIQRFLPCF